MQAGSLGLVAAGALVTAGSLYLLVAVRRGAPAAQLDGAIVARAAPRPAPELEMPTHPVPIVAPVRAPEPAVIAPAPAVTAPAPPPPAPPPPPPALVLTTSGLQYEDVRVGTGDMPAVGQTCVVHYTGWLWVDGAKGAQIDSSRDRAAPMRFTCGAGQVIKGWDEGVGTMRVGGLRTLIVPANLGYGDGGSGSTIPAGATLRFEVELIAVE